MLTYMQKRNYMQEQLETLFNEYEDFNIIDEAIRAGFKKDSAGNLKLENNGNILKASETKNILYFIGVKAKKILRAHENLDWNGFQKLVKEFKNIKNENDILRFQNKYFDTKGIYKESESGTSLLEKDIKNLKSKIKKQIEDLSNKRYKNYSKEDIKQIVYREFNFSSMFNESSDSPISSKASLFLMHLEQAKDELKAIFSKESDRERKSRVQYALSKITAVKDEIMEILKKL